MTIFSSRPSKPLTFQIRVAETEDDFQAVFALRARVFRDEQRLADLPMTDGDERRSCTLMAELEGMLIGTGRLTPPQAQRTAYLSWIATDRAYRKHGVGSAIVEELVARADAANYPMTLLSAQTHAIRFYRQFDYRPIGTVFSVRGIPHQSMSRVRPSGS
ncbi:MAG: GNAT family N-acetyltransferase [Thermomicrobiales bacterium]|nr:GNAT family N-acetyltransferase [Thermomicrobiales bacterium]MCO5220479.1 GNAT family N-acetyltransferase [Thermomicrobiales bacterium]